jgi:hypothetical protein
LLELPVAVFIFLLWFILFGRKIRKGISLSRGEKALAYITLFFLIASVIPQYFEFFGVTSSTFIPYLADIERGILIILPILAVLIVIAVVNSHKKGIRRFLTMRSHSKLKRKITKELENEATTKKLAFSHQPKKEILSILANRVSIDLMDIPTPKQYPVQMMKDRDGDVCIGADILSIPLVSAEILADKMTKLSNDPRYRKKRKLLSCLVR